MSSVGFQCRLSLKTRTTCSLKTTLQHFPLTFFEVQVVHYPRPHVLAIPSMKAIFGTVLLLAALWLAVILLAVLTSIALIASSTRADCGTIPSPTTIRSIIDFFLSDVVACTLEERISTLVRKE